MTKTIVVPTFPVEMAAAAVAKLNGWEVIVCEPTDVPLLEDKKENTFYFISSIFKERCCTLHEAKVLVYETELETSESAVDFILTRLPKSFSMGIKAKFDRVLKIIRDHVHHPNETSANFMEGIQSIGGVKNEVATFMKLFKGDSKVTLEKVLEEGGAIVRMKRAECKKNIIASGKRGWMKTFPCSKDQKWFAVFSPQNITLHHDQLKEEKGADVTIVFNAAWKNRISVRVWNSDISAVTIAKKFCGDHCGGNDRQAGGQIQMETFKDLWNAF